MAQPRYKANEKVKGGTLKRTRQRLARIRLENPNALQGIKGRGYTGRQARKIKKTAAALPKPKPTKKGPASDRFDPLAPLTGKEFTKELGAKQTLEFGDRERALAQQVANQAQTTANTGTYYDDYRQALREATARINETNRVKDENAANRVSTAYQEDKAGVQARDAAADEQAAKFGRAPQHSAEGAQAVEAARSQGNQQVNRMTQSSADDTELMEKRGATAVLAKAQALAREQARARRLEEDKTALEKEKGAFRVNERDKARQSERQYEAIKKEFGLEKRKVDISAKQGRADRALEKQKIAAQKIVARIYASADKAGARAQVRVAELQLKKGKITKNQMRTIRNIYEGLPGGGSRNHPDAGTKGGPGGTKLQPWERDKISNAVSILRSHKAKPEGKATWIARMQKEGVPLRLARIAWARYMKKRPSIQPQTGRPTS